MGHPNPGGLGIRDCELRLVDWNRPRGHADLRDSSAAQTGLAHFDQSFRGSYDFVRGSVRGNVSDIASRAAMARVLAPAVSEHDVAMAAASQPFDLGRFCCIDVCL